MSALRNVLDRLNDIEAAISRLGRDESEPDFAIQLSLKSLERRRDMLKEELKAIANSEFVDICDYKILPEQPDSYAMNAVTGAWHNFQDMISLVFASVEANQARNTAKVSKDVAQKSQLNFGYAYQGSLGIVMTIRNDRLIAAETNLDKSVSVVFDAMRATSSDKIREIRQKYGIPVVRKLHELSKLHSQYGMSAEIKWKRDDNIKESVVAQSPEFEQICKIIEAKSDETSEPVEVVGNLLAWNVQTKTFVLEFPDSEPISGHWADDFDGSKTREVPARYFAKLTKKTIIKYAEEKDQVTWHLHDLTEIKSQLG